MKNNTAVYCKEQLVNSGRFNKDAAQAILRADKRYTLEEAAAAIEKFMKKEVK